MSGAAAPGRRGRRGRRTTRMIQVAQERIDDLFALARLESRRIDPSLADRYVLLARRIGTRYNVRVPAEYRELYCRGCSAFWIEGRTVRTRLRGGLRVRTCKRCGRQRRSLLRPSGFSAPPVGTFLPPGSLEDSATVEELSVPDADAPEEGEEE
ncbi:MAG: hypothetical protein L3K17_02785 [Thermoplasmata archaeon]|nr:hypothetical protein [Thermoplasmata archaeon]